MEINDLVGLKEPLLKLIEVVSSGIGKAYEPTHIKRTAKAKAEEINLISEAIDKNIALPVEYKNGNITVDAQNIQELMVRAQNRVLFQEIRKQKNIESIVEKAYIELKEEKDVSSEEVDQDWIIRFFNSIEDISEENMQKIWAKILVGEIKKPKSFSKRTLEALKNISKDEAEIFEKVSKGIICDALSDKEYLFKNLGITYGDIYLLSQCNLMGITLMTNTIKLEKTKYEIQKFKDFSIFAYGKETMTLNYTGYPLTKIGEEIISILDINPTKETIEMMTNIIKLENSHLGIEMKQN